MEKLNKLEQMLKECEAVLSKEDHSISNMSNCCAIIQKYFNFHWVGFYLVDDNTNQLYLGPFQGPLACTRIPFGKGVCGTAWKESKTQVVADVHKFPGHIACSSLTNSEIVVPITRESKVVAVLDIDSVEFDSFSDKDKEYFENLALFLSERI
jgi:L-methionine (R)-S-oxide reductase